MTTVIKQQDFIDSVYEGLQYISYYHPMDFLEALKKAYEREQNQPAKDAIAQILVNSKQVTEYKRDILLTQLACLGPEVGNGRCEVKVYIVYHNIPLLLAE